MEFAIALSSYAHSRGCYNTESFELADPQIWNDHGHYCSYCGEKCKKVDDYHDRDIHGTYFHCDCESAQKEIETRRLVYDLQEKVDRSIHIVKRNTPPINVTMVNDRKYAHELLLLQRKYNRVPEDIRFRKFD